MTQDVYLFSYGTLQLEPVQISTFGRSLEGRPDSIPGWRMDSLEITDANVLKTSGEKFHPLAVETGRCEDEIAGMVYAITPEELAQSDAYEVSDYKRVEIRLKSGAQAWVYVKA